MDKGPLPTIKETLRGDGGSNLLQSDPQSSERADERTSLLYGLRESRAREDPTRHRPTGSEHRIQEDRTTGIRPSRRKMGEHHVDCTPGRTSPDGLPAVSLKMTKRFFRPWVGGRGKQGRRQTA
jgi:hypothetical protein